MLTAAGANDRIVLVGHEKRYDPGVAFAHDFIRDGIGELIGLKHWYCDSTYRYSITDTLQPLIETSAAARRPPGNPKADRKRYLVLGHGSHLLDTARYLGGPLEAIRARLSTKAGSYCWFLEVAYANGCLGQLDLTVAVRMDWWEGFQVYGSEGSVIGKLFNPWHCGPPRCRRSRPRTTSTTSRSGRTRTYSGCRSRTASPPRPPAPPRVARPPEDGARLRTGYGRPRPVGQHRRVGRLDEVTEDWLMKLGIFAKTFDRADVDACLQAVADAGIPATQFNLSVVGLPTIPDAPVPGR